MSDAKAPTVLPLHPNNLVEAEVARRLLRVVPLVGVTLEQMKQPEYWAHVARSLQPNDKLEVLAEDGTWYAELLVRDATMTGARVVVLMYKDLDDGGAPALERADLDVTHHPSLKWTVIRKKDKKRLAENLPDRQAAQQWIANNPDAV
jgi:hypothetical protein